MALRKKTWIIKHDSIRGGRIVCIFRKAAIGRACMATTPVGKSLHQNHVRSCNAVPKLWTRDCMVCILCNSQKSKTKTIFLFNIYNIGKYLKIKLRRWKSQVTRRKTSVIFISFLLTYLGIYIFRPIPTTWDWNEACNSRYLIIRRPHFRCKVTHDDEWL